MSMDTYTYHRQRAALMGAIRVAGSQRKLAIRLRAIGCHTTQQGISAWARNGMPVQYAPYVEAATGISRWMMLPDQFYADIQQAG